MIKNHNQERKEYWLTLINKWQTSGKSAFKWCQENHISYKSFYRWRSIFNQKANANLKAESFVELKNSKQCTLEIEYKKYKLCLRDFNFAEAHDLFKILKAL